MVSTSEVPSELGNSGPTDIAHESPAGDEPAVMPSPTEAARGSVPLATAAADGSQQTADAGASDADAEVPSATPPPIDASATPGCASSEHLGPHDRCYTTVATLLSWSEARRSCRSLGDGWDLAAIRDAEVNQFLAALVTNEAWIAASDRGNEGTWVWVDDGVTFWTGSADAGSAASGAYVNWSAAEPNNAGNSDCARLLLDSTGAWADLDCAALRSAVCEGPLR